MEFSSEHFFFTAKLIIFYFPFLILFLAQLEQRSIMCQLLMDLSFSQESQPHADPVCIRKVFKNFRKPIHYLLFLLLKSWILQRISLGSWVSVHEFSIFTSLFSITFGNLFDRMLVHQEFEGSVNGFGFLNSFSSLSSFCPSFYGNVNSHGQVGFY